MNVIAWGGQDLWLLIELSDLLCQQGEIRPPWSVSIRNPPCSQIPKAIEQKFNMFLARPFAEEIRDRKRPSEQGIAAGDLARALCDNRERHISYDCGQLIRGQVSHGDCQDGRILSGDRGGSRTELFEPST